MKIKTKQPLKFYHGFAVGASYHEGDITMKIYQVDLPPMLQNNAVVIFDDTGNCINSSLYTTADDAAKASRAAQLAAQLAAQSPDAKVIKANFVQLMANCQHIPDPVAKEV